MKKIILAAGSGYLGQVLIEQLDKEFDEFVVLTRGQNKTNGKVK
ncbi:MAG: epimerase, partial [Bacteroidia bacterium]|nr:epimerase [Bacteroidia bacterium]